MIPDGSVEQMLHAMGSVVSDMLRKLPSILALDGTEQSLQKLACLLTGWCACKAFSNTLDQAVEMLLPEGKRNELLGELGKRLSIHNSVVPQLGLNVQL